jgi:hypothetical protein
MIFSGGFLRKPPVEIDSNMRFLKKTACRNYGFLVTAVFLINHNQK